MRPRTCPKLDSDSLSFGAPGIEKLQLIRIHQLICKVSLSRPICSSKYRTLKEVITVASNQIEAVKRAARDAGVNSAAVQKAYREYWESMEKRKQRPESLQSIVAGIKDKK